MDTFKAVIEIIGVNPFVFVPERILENIFQQAGKSKGSIPVQGTINGKAYTQTLVRYSGHWRLYINLKMLANSPKRIGEKIAVTIAFDNRDRSIPMHAKLAAALRKNKTAHQTFTALSPSRQKEIVRYIGALKTEESVVKNIEKAIGFLTGKNRFAGRDPGS